MVALKTQKMRGQAFVVFEEPAAAAQALRALQGMIFYEKPIRVQYSKHISKAVFTSKGQPYVLQPVVDTLKRPRQPVDADAQDDELRETKRVC